MAGAVAAGGGVLAHNLTEGVFDNYYAEWTAKPEFKLPNWGEAVVFVTILSGGMILTRRRDYHVLGRRRRVPYTSVWDRSPRHSQDVERVDMNGDDDDDDDDDDDERRSSVAREKPRPRSRCAWSLGTVSTPGRSRFERHIHSRVLQKFPFLVEMLYWVLNYLFYRMTTVLSNRIFAGKGTWDVAQDHAITILGVEQFGCLSFLFPCRELDVQQWFMRGHQDALTFLDRFYSLVHIPGSMAFIVWYYRAAPSHAAFATVRRTMTWTNFMAFVTFVFFPVMPPRLLPKEYGFLDTVHMEHAASLWQTGKHVNSLAAMPSMHFGYSFIIGCTFIGHSGVFRRRGDTSPEMRKNAWGTIFYCTLGLLYPSMILITILATANHYMLDATVALIYCGVAFASNKVLCVFLPVEHVFLWAIRAAKPIPTTGERFHARGGKM